MLRRGCGWRGPAGIAGLVAALAAGDAAAQVKSATVVHDDAQLFHPATDPTRFLSVYDTRNLDPGRYTLGLYLNYAQDPVQLRFQQSNQDSADVVKNLFGADLVGALGVTDRFQLGLDVPYVHTDVNDAVLSNGSRLEGGTDTIGDIALEAKYTLIPRPVGQGFGFSLLPRILLPTGDLDNFAGTGDVQYGGLLLADWRYAKVNYGLNLGGLIRDGFGNHDGNDDLDDQMLYGAGVTVPVHKMLDLVGELNGRTAFKQRANPLEAMLAARFHRGTIAFTFGVGFGVTESRGTPTFRIVASVTPYIPEKEIPPPMAELVANSRKIWRLATDVDADARPNPGDTLEYTVTLVNTGTKDAEQVVFVDPIPQYVSYVPGSLAIGGQPATDVIDGDAGDYAASNAGAVTVKIPSISNRPEQNTFTFSFQVLADPEIVDLVVVRNEAVVYHKDQPAVEGSDEETGPRVGERLQPTETTLFPRIRERETVVVTPDKLELTRNIHFEFNKSVIRPESFPVLDDVAGVLKDNPQLNIRVEGHTDSVGGVEYNQKLSERRADSVKRYLVSKGTGAARLTTDGKGKLSPIASNDTAVGRAMNRRVEFLIVNPDILKGRRIEKRPFIEDITPDSEPGNLSAPAEAGVAPTGDRATLEAQQALTQLGYNPGQATGIMTSQTADAIRRFQGDNGLPVTGTPDATTRKALEEALELERSR